MTTTVPRHSPARQLHLKHLVALAKRRLLFARIARKHQPRAVQFKTRSGGRITVHLCAIHKGSWRVTFPDDDHFDHSCVGTWKGALDEVRVHGGLPETMAPFGGQ